MASHVLKVADVWPAATSVGVHLASGSPADSPPVSGAALSSVAVAADGTLTFTGLADDTAYVALEPVGGRWRRFRSSPLVGSGSVLSRIDVFGHSYPDEAGLTDPRSTGFARVVAGKLGAQLANHAVGGSSAYMNTVDTGALTRVLQEVRPGRYFPAASPVECAIVHTGLNDIGQSAVFAAPGLVFTDTYQAMIDRCRAGVVWEMEDGAPWTTSIGTGGTDWAVPGATTQFSGTGTKRARDNGNTATLTLPSDFPGGTVQVVGLKGSGIGALWTVTVDGVAAASWELRGGSLNYTPGTYEVTGLAAGAHTIVFTCTNLVSTSYIDYAQVPAAVPPLVVINLLNRIPSTTFGTSHSVTDADIVSSNALTTAMIASRYTDGRVLAVDIDSVLAKAAALFSDSIHPNDAGHLKIADAVTAAILGALPRQTARPARAVEPGVLYSPKVPTAGLDKRMGSSTLVAGTVTISSFAITANTEIFCMPTSGGVGGQLVRTARVAKNGTTPGTITVTSQDATGATVAGDTRAFTWLLIDGAAR